MLHRFDKNIPAPTSLNSLISSVKSGQTLMKKSEMGVLGEVDEVCLNKTCPHLEHKLPSFWQSIHINFTHLAPVSF